MWNISGGRVPGGEPGQSVQGYPQLGFAKIAAAFVRRVFSRLCLLCFGGLGNLTTPNPQEAWRARAAWIGLQAEFHRKGDFAWICACPRCVGLKWRGCNGLAR